MECPAPHSPHGLVEEPASVALVEPVLKGGLELLRAGDDSADALAG